MKLNNLDYLRDKFMRILVFFDLPVRTKDDRRHYADFRKFLIRQGFLMLQFSVYARVCKGLDEVHKHIKRVSQNLPPRGSVRALEVTDKQYERMKLLLGPPKKEEQIGSEQLLLF